MFVTHTTTDIAVSGFRLAEGNLTSFTPFPSPGVLFLSIHLQIREQVAEKGFQTLLKVAVAPTQIILLNFGLNCKCFVKQVPYTVTSYPLQWLL